jgi:glycosyltransferase involved in cell wall biosynthesis
MSRTVLPESPAAAAGRAIARAGAWLYLLAGTAGRLLAARLRGALGSRPGRAAAAPSLPARRPRVLIVMPYPIVPTDHGGAVRVLNLIRQLAPECDLYLLVFSRAGDDAAQREALAPWVEGVWFHPWQPDRHSPGRPPPGLLEPPSAHLFADPRVAFAIRDLVERHRIDVVELEYTELAQYRRAAGRVPVILVEHDVSWRSFGRRRRLGLPRRFPASRVFGATFGDWMRLLRYEVAACREVEQVHVMSAADAAYLGRFLPDSTRRLRIVPNGVDCAGFRPPEPPPPRRGVLLAGNFHTLPNLDAFEYFLAEVWPEVRRRRPDAAVAVVGAAMPPRLHEWHGRDGVTVVGGVPDMRPVYHRHQVLAVPLRAGSGTRLKLLEAFAAGLPVASTTIGAEGIDCVPGEHLLLADDAAGLAQAVDRLLGDPGLAARLAANAMRLAADRYDWAASARAHLDGIRQLLPAPLRAG